MAANTTLSFREVYMLLCQIEIVLNSYPITLLSSYSSEYSSLKLTYFLVSGLITLTQDISDIFLRSQKSLKRLTTVKKQMQPFWGRRLKKYNYIGFIISSGKVVLISS